jgi:surface-anchored protein
VVASFSDARAWQIENRQGQSATEFVPLGAGTYVKGQQLQPVLHFGVPLNVHGTPTLSLRIGNRVAKAKYLGLDGEMALRFGCDLLESDSDSDGIELASTELERAGGTVTDALGRTVNLSLPPLSASGVLVAGSAPYVESITRADGTPSSRQRVSFYVHFSKPVSSVDLQDFTLRSSGGLSGASLDLVAANGRDVYVGVNTGRGSGTLQLAIADSATIQDANGIALVNGYQGGEVYTLDRNPPRSIETYYTQGHGDLTPVFANEQWSTEVRTGQTQTVQNLLIVGGNSALTTRPSAEQFGFLGVAAGEALYVWPASGMPNIPQLGFGGAGIPAGVLASYQHPDPRVNALGQWVDMRVVGLRSSSAGALSLYTTDVFGQSKVWIATADGITDVDKLVFAAGSHQHFNFAFSKAGTYELDVVFSGYRDRNGNGQREAVDPYIESGVTTLYFAVDTASSPVPYRVRGAVEKACNVTRYPLEAGNLLLHSRHTDVFTLEADCTDAKQPQLVMSTSYDSLSGGDFKEHHRFEDVLLYASPVNQLVGFPELTNPNKSLLAAQTGDTVWMFPEGAPDDTALPWPGLQSYNIPQGLFYDDDVQMELVGVDGPVGSAVQLFYSPQDELSPFDFKFDSSRSLAPWTVPGGTHVHLNWLFTHAGLYRMNFRLKSTLVDGTTVQSQQKTLKVWVGDIALLPSSEPTQFKVEGVDGAGVNGSTLLTAVTYGRPPASTELIRWYKQCVYYAAQPAVQGAWTVAGEGSTLDVVRFTAEDGLASCAYRALLHDSGGAVLARSQAFGQ